MRHAESAGRGRGLGAGRSAHCARTRTNFNGCSGIDTITLFDPSPFSVKIGGGQGFQPEAYPLRNRSTWTAAPSSRWSRQGSCRGRAARDGPRVPEALGSSLARPRRRGRAVQQRPVERGPDRGVADVPAHFLPDSASGLVAI
jgi:hypothetical protein